MLISQALPQLTSTPILFAMASSGTEVSEVRENDVVEQMAGSKRSFRLKCFELADRWFNRLIRLTTALHECFWLGFLSVDDLNSVTAEHYGNSRLYASATHNLSGLAGWETSALQRYFRPRSRILVAAAGGGREVLALRKVGFAADGFECSLSLVRVSHEIFDQVGEPNYVVHCPPDSVPPGPSIYNGLIVGWTAYTHIPTRLRRIFFLRALRARALPQSPILISFFTRRADSRYDVFIHRTAMFCRFFLRGRKEPLELGDRLSFGRYVRCFTDSEVEAELRAAGFRLAHFCEEGDSGHAVGIAE